jgi:hypothetical protein
MWQSLKTDLVRSAALIPAAAMTSVCGDPLAFGPVSRVSFGANFCKKSGRLLVIRGSSHDVVSSMALAGRKLELRLQEGIKMEVFTWKILIF